MVLKVNIENVSVIAISSPPGGGKSTLANALIDAFSAVSSIDYDDFQEITTEPIEKIETWADSGGDYNDFELPLLESALARLKQGDSVINPANKKVIESQKTIFFQAPFGREHKKTACYIDQLIWLDTPLDIAIARSSMASIDEFKKHDEMAYEHALGFLDWQKAYFHNYIQSVRPLLLSQREKIINTADIVLDGNLSVDALVDSIKSRINLYGK